MNKTQKIEYMAYQTLLYGETNDEFSINDILQEITNTDYLINIITKSNSKILFENRSCILYIIKKLLNTDYGSRKLLKSVGFIPFNKSELKYIVETVINKYPDQTYYLCDSFSIRNYYRHLKLSAVHVESLESALTLYRLSNN